MNVRKDLFIFKAMMCVSLASYVTLSAIFQKNLLFYMNVDSF